MKIHYEYVKEMTLEEFADEHGLEMVIKERERPRSEKERFYEQLSKESPMIYLWDEF